MMVSIICPVFNSADFLDDSIRSVLKQSFHDWQLILIDDQSTDDSYSLALTFEQEDSRIKVLRLDENSGAAAARNKGIEFAQGRYIAFLDSDDLWSPNKLEIQLKFMQENNIAFSYSAYQKIDENGFAIGVVGVPKQVSYNDLLKTNCIGCLTAIYDTKKLGKVYMPTNTKREDFATWLNILKKIDYAYGMNEMLAQYRVYSSQSSAKKMKMAKENWRLYRDIEKLGLLRSAYYFSHYAFRGILRSRFPRIARLLKVLN